MLYKFEEIKSTIKDWNSLPRNLGHSRQPSWDNLVFYFRSEIRVLAGGVERGGQTSQSFHCRIIRILGV